MKKENNNHRMIFKASTTQIISKNLMYIPAFFIGLGISSEAFLALAVLMIIDTFTGVVRVGVVRGWRHVRSVRLSTGIVAKMTLLLVPISLALAGLGIGADITSIVNATTSVLILAEVYSVVSNIYCIRTGKEIKEFDAVAAVLESLRKSLERIIISHKDNAK